jgi:hypothetical protein
MYELMGGTGMDHRLNRGSLDMKDESGLAYPEL